MNPDIARLKPYPFERLNSLLAGAKPPKDLRPIPLSIGEPKHLPPAFVLEHLCANIADLGAYPTTHGLPELRSAIAAWLTRRYGLGPGRMDPERHVLPLNGTREGLFALAQAVMDGNRRDPVVLLPNPFYQIYEGAALLAGAECVFMNADEGNGYLPDLEAVPDATWQRCQLIYLCSPGNPTGAVPELPYIKRLLELADRHGFVVASDECYAEIYQDAARPPLGLLEACEKLGRHGFERCVVFHSLSKRSSLPGIRSGFVAGDAQIVEKFLRYRTYHGCSLPIPVQKASQLAWSDERHVAENRALYRKKFETAAKVLRPVLDFKIPEGSFYLWPRTPVDDERFVRGLFETQYVTILPGSYLSRETPSGDPGRNRVRISLVAPMEECEEALWRIRRYVESL